MQYPAKWHPPGVFCDVPPCPPIFIRASKYLQKLSAIQNNYVTLSSMSMAIIVCNSE